jgi:hypothetical protein
MTFAKWFIAAGVLAVAVAVPAQAQDKKEVQGYIAGGYVLPEGKADDYLDGGWNISGGVIFRPMPAKPFGVRLDLGYSSMDANNNAVNLGNAADYLVDGGYMSMGNLTAEFMWEFGNPDKFGGYLAVGGGGYRRYAALTADVQQLGYVCDPYWGCYYASYVGTQTLASDSLIKWGWSVAGGATFAVGSGQLYVEARYHWMMSSPSTQYLPILIGYRF